MAADGIAYQYQNQEGWTDATLLLICLEYIGNQQDDSAFEEFLQGKVLEDQEEVEKGPIETRQRFDVDTKEIHTQTVSVHADSPEQAAAMVQDGQGKQQGGAEYSRTLPVDTWTIRNEGGGLFDSDGRSA